MLWCPLVRTLCRVCAVSADILLVYSCWRRKEAYFAQLYGLQQLLAHVLSHNDLITQLAYGVNPLCTVCSVSVLSCDVLSRLLLV